MKTIAITGGGRGIGRATARILAARGHRIAVADVDLPEAEAVAEEIGCEAFRVDVSDRSSVRSFLRQVDEDMGGLDVVINNAGIASAASRATEQDPALLERTIDVNLKGVMYGTVEGIEILEPKRSGQIVNIASLAGLIGVPGLAAYAAAKHGVVGFTESVRIEYEGSGIDFTCVMPGPVATGMMDGTSSSPLVKLLEPEEMALAIADAVESGKERVSLPRASWFLSRYSSLLPARASMWLNKITRVDRIYTDVDPAARREYEDRISK